MKIQYVKGDLFMTDATHILHGCNAQGVMGSGIARIIRDTYPYAYKCYTERHQIQPWKLGEIQVVQCRDRIIINAITQQFYGKDGIRYVSYDAVANAMKNVEENLYGITLAMPMIGAGLGGGDWKVIEAIIESELKTVKPIVYYLE